MGREAIKRRQIQESADKLAKEKADRENKDATGRLAADNKRLRDDRDSRRRFLSDPAPDSRSPDLACFARTEFESAVGGLIGSLRGISQEGDQSALDLRLSREWAAGR